MTGVSQRRKALRRFVLAGPAPLATAAVDRRPVRRRDSDQPSSPPRGEGLTMRARHVLPLVAVLCAAGFVAGCGGSSDETTMSLIEHAETDTVRHIGPAK